jgi:hypothetical protein
VPSYVNVALDIMTYIYIHTYIYPQHWSAYTYIHIPTALERIYIHTYTHSIGVYIHTYMYPQHGSIHNERRLGESASALTLPT